MKLRVQLLVLATLALAGAAYADNPCYQANWNSLGDPPCYSPSAEPYLTFPGPGDYFQINYFANLVTIGDSVINITNDGSSLVVPYNRKKDEEWEETSDFYTATILDPATSLCIGVYIFDQNEELQSCCACEVTPNGLVSLSLRANNMNNLTGAVPDSEVVKLLAWSTTGGASTTAPPGTPIPPNPSASVCNASNPGPLASGMHAWGTHLHASPVPSPTFFGTENEFSGAILSDGEYSRIKTLCAFTQIAGSGTSGQCKGCQSGGMGAAAVQ